MELTTTIGAPAVREVEGGCLVDATQYRVEPLERHYMEVLESRLLVAGAGPGMKPDQPGRRRADLVRVRVRVGA
jgi:hypothetical protein